MGTAVKTEPVWCRYQRSAIAEMTPWDSSIDMSRVSVNAEDKEKNGSPKAGDYIARNPKNHNDKWLVEATYFRDNFITTPIGVCEPVDQTDTQAEAGFPAKD